MVTARRLRLDRIASATRNAGLEREVVVGPEIVCREGYVLAVRIRGHKSVYNQVEDVHGRMVPLRDGDVLAGVLGSRRALRGYAGEVPEALAPGATVNVLNLGGVLGRCTSVNPEIGPPYEAEVLGAILDFPAAGDRLGRPAHIRRGAIPPAEELTLRAPIVFIAGTCMDAGKTVAGTAIVRGLTRAGLRVVGAKLTGVSLRRDVLSMGDAGAIEGLSFTDCGIVSTRAEEALPAARGLLNRADHGDPDVVVAELGDGILGEYGVEHLLSAPDLMAKAGALVFCAPDPVAAWGGVTLLRERWGLTPSVISGPVTDNEVGSRFVRDSLGIAAWNARRDPEALAACVRENLRVRA
jgi:hypothetical protein